MALIVSFAVNFTTYEFSKKINNLLSKIENVFTNIGLLLEPKKLAIF